MPSQQRGHHHSEILDLCSSLNYTRPKINGGGGGGGDVDDDVVICNAVWDTVVCWPPTPVGHVAIVSCPPQFVGLSIDTSENATRVCQENGTWQLKSDYSNCRPLLPSELPDPSAGNVVNIIYCSGFLASIVALTISLVIFLRFKILRCMRNTIHCHLIVTFLLRMLVWLLIYYVLSTLEYDKSNIPIHWFCKAIVVLFNYIQVTNFFWMLVEGLYLHTMIVCPFAAARVQLWHYSVLGWGLPLVIIFVWVLHKAIVDDEMCWLPKKTGPYEYIFIAPILCVLFINLLILANIVWVLVTKLRESKNLPAIQYRIAVKSTLVLFPLLGVTYLFFLIDLSNGPVGRKAVAYANAFLQSTQGFFVALFYCFLNGEVRSTMKSWMKNVRDGYSMHSIGGCIFRSLPSNNAVANSNRRIAASSVTELTKQDIEMQSNRHQSLSLGNL